jgi:hypothetical protein
VRRKRAKLGERFERRLSGAWQVLIGKNKLFSESGIFMAEKLLMA